MTIRGGMVVFLALGLMACHKPSPTQGREDRIVQRWLLCDECVEGELDSLLALGARGQAAMIEALKGPPKERLVNIRLQAEAMYARIPTPGTPRQKFVDHYLANYKAIYHRRAAVALQRFNTPTAHAALLDALRHDTQYRTDVVRGLGEAAGARVSIAAGDSQHAPLGAFVQVNPTVLVRDTTTAQPLSGVGVVFQVDSGGGLVQPSTRMTGSDGKADVRWRLGSTDSMNLLRAVAAGQTVRFVATGHPPGPRIVFVRQPRDAARNQPMVPAPGIAIQDAWGVTQSNFSGQANARVIPLNIGLVQNVVNGEALFSGLTIPQPGNGYSLRVQVLGLAPAESEPFNVVP